MRSTISSMNKTPYKAPDFQLKDSEGQVRNLDDYKGQWLALYFYPKDDTPGCTTQACSMRDARDDLAELGASIVGINKDDASEHEKFKAKHSLNFTLLTDETGEVLESYDAWGDNGSGQAGILRKTFLIDPEGMIQKVYGQATPEGHGQQIVQDLKDLQE